MQGQKIAAIVNSAEPPAVGVRVGVAMDLSRACLFDPQSEQRL
jgi:hypothetical protein